MPQYTGPLDFPPYDGPHEIIEYAPTPQTGYLPEPPPLLRCIKCDVVVDPADVSAHLALNEALPKV